MPLHWVACMNATAALLLCRKLAWGDAQYIQAKLYEMV